MKVKEKFVKYGADSLSDSELVSLVIGDDFPDISQNLIDRFKGLKGLERADYLDLSGGDLFCLQQHKAIRLSASIELGRRIEIARHGERVQLLDPEDAAAFIRPRLRGLEYEVFYVIFLNNSKIVTGVHKLSSGGSTATIVDVKEVMRQAILRKAGSIVLAHNHPSGDTRESQADRDVTTRIVEAGKLMGIPVDDHIIIAGDDYTSFRQRGII